MGNQGTINPIQKQSSPLEGIATALKIVHDVYGLDTIGAQQKLLETQNQLEQTKLGSEQAKASAIKGFVDRQASKNAPQSNPAQSGPPTVPAGPSQMVASNGPASPPVNTSEVSTKSQGPSKVSPPSSPTYSQADLENPAIAEFLQPSIKAQGEVLGQQKTKEEMRTARIKEYEEPVTKFNEDTKDIKQEIETYKAIGKKLTSGNPADIKAAKLLLAKQEVGVKRVSQFLADQVGDPAFLAHLEEKGSLSRGGGLPAEETGKLLESVNLGMQNASQRLTSTADERASQLAVNHGTSKENALKRLIPNGTGAQPFDFKILPDPDGQNSVYLKSGSQWKSPTGHTYDSKQVAHLESPLARSIKAGQVIPAGVPIPDDGPLSRNNIIKAKNIALGLGPAAASFLRSFIPMADGGSHE